VVYSKAYPVLPRWLDGRRGGRGGSAASFRSDGWSSTEGNRRDDGVGPAGGGDGPASCVVGEPAAAKLGRIERR
jgi:hypothetical protein